jgi:hypothetical protein
VRSPLRRLAPGAGDGAIDSRPLSRARRHDGERQRHQTNVARAGDDAGGQEYLAQQAVENPTAFMTLVGKVLPKSVDVSHENPFAHMDDEALIREAERLAASLGCFKH